MEKFFPKKLFHGCIGHVINLMFKDILRKICWLNLLDKDVKKMVKTFRLTTLLDTRLHENQKEKKIQALSNPGSTRWESSFKMFETTLLNDEYLYYMVNERNFINSNNLDFNFFQQ